MGGVRATRVAGAIVLMPIVLGFGGWLIAQSPSRIELITVGTDGTGGNNASGANPFTDPFPPRTRVSADGRFVVFESEAHNLVCTDANVSTSDIFVRDRLLGTTTLVSTAWDGSAANHNSMEPVISADGRWVAFVSEATNLVPDDTNGFNDVFLRDLRNGTTVRVSVSSSGEQANSVSHGPSISGDGRYVAYYGGGSNLVPNDTNNQWDVFVYDAVAGTTERVSVSSSGQEGSCCRSVFPTISKDGRYVAFQSQNRFDPAFANNREEVFIRDRQTGTTVLASLTSAGGPSAAGVFFSMLSADGRSLAWQSSSTDVVSAPDANGTMHDIFLRNLDTGVTTLVSVASDGTQGNRDSFMPSLSGNGRFVAFHSWSNNLVPGDTNTTPVYDVFLRDVQLGQTNRISVSPGGAEANGSSTSASLSEDGRWLFFQSLAGNLASDHPNGYQDVFLYGPPLGDVGAPGIRFDSAQYDHAENGGTATVTVVRSGNVCGTASVQYAAAGGTAGAGDYTLVPGVLTFASGESRRTFTVTIVDDAEDEADETVVLTLSNATGMALGDPSTAALTILDDDQGSNAPPDAVDDGGATSEDTSVTIAVLANDSDPNGDALVVSGVTQGSHGAVVNTGNGSVVYTPAANFNGSDTFQYTVSDGMGGADTASVVVSIVPVNDAPTAVTDHYSTRQGTLLNIAAGAGVLANDSDADGGGLTAVVVVGPAQGTLGLGADGSFLYTPTAGFAGSDTFTYRAVDQQQAASNTATVTIVVEGAVFETSSCRPVTPASVHRVGKRDFMGEPFLANRRLTAIENDTVPCVEVDTMEATRCVFKTGQPSPVTGRREHSGDWMEDAQGQRYAVVGQPVTRDGTLSAGSFIVGTVPDADNNVACVARSGRDAAGSLFAVRDADLAETCMVEWPGGSWNFGGLPLQNYATRFVGTSSIPHPDGVTPTAVDPTRGVAWYTGLGAALNDTAGMERDPTGFYYGMDWSCHLVTVGGMQVPAAKRPATRSFPPPAVVDPRSPILWRPVNPYVDIANDAPFDMRRVGPPQALFTYSLGPDGLSVDASRSSGDILHYFWDFDWTTEATDFRSSSPTAHFPITTRPRPFGLVTLIVVAHDGQTSTHRERIDFRRLPPPPAAAQPSQ
jgi:Tol biopolymer transport system component